MSRDSNTQILRYLNFSDYAVEPKPGSPDYDPLFIIRPVVKRLNDTFGSKYIPRRNVTNDECMVPFKSRTPLNSTYPANLTNGV